MPPSKKKLKQAQSALRKLIDSSQDPIVCRIAYAMETTITWATQDTVDWPMPHVDARILAEILRKELNS